jgi:hypothetical protein
MTAPATWKRETREFGYWGATEQKTQYPESLPTTPPAPACPSFTPNSEQTFTPNNSQNNSSQVCQIIRKTTMETLNVKNNAALLAIKRHMTPA